MSCSNDKPCNLQVNGYKIFDILDDGMYVSKSKEDLIESVKKYGDIEEVYGVTEQELLEEVKEISLCSKQAKKIQDWGDDEVCCIYELYHDIARNDGGTQMILTYNM